jgi:cytochrome c5
VLLKLSPLLLLPLLAACGGEQPRDAMPSFDDPDLVLGKNTWMQVCRNCHLNGVAGAPAVSDAAAWQQRAAKGRQALYHSAINGISTGEGWSMPPRGGGDRLTDIEIRHAVDYMLAAQAALADQENP